ncbi:MAG: serine/threonine protein kinase [Verrucomicrobia bacterium]|nr:serine/threonine protein kinase [Verrucomicrobiota bacterium]
MCRPLLSPGLLLVWAAAVVQAAASAEWPEFRGPTGQGSSAARGLPVEWSETRHVAWVTPIPGAGWSSPVAGDGRVFLTAGRPRAEGGASLHVLALEAATGRVLWDREVFAGAGIEAQPPHRKNSPASPTPLLADGRVYAHFGHLGSACLDREGRILWRNDEVRYDSVHGNGGSPVLAGDLLIHHADGAKDPFVIALDRNTGAVRWRTARTVRPKQTFSFATPLLVGEGAAAQLISPASGAVAALDPRDGRELWHVRYGGGFSVVPRPVVGHGLVFVATGYARADLLAIRLGGSGDVTDTHVAWRTTKGAPLTPSLVLDGDELYGVSDMGVATCWDARTGNVHWQEKLEGGYSASPLLADGRLYFQNENGLGTVVAAGRGFRRLANNSLGERTLASYAVTGRALLIRTESRLYRIENP